MDVRSLFAAQTYAAARPALQPEPATGGTAEAAIKSFEATLKQAETTAQTSMVSSADPHALVAALAQSELAVETVVTVRNKVVEAYQEILRMPV